MDKLRLTVTALMSVAALAVAGHASAAPPTPAAEGRIAAAGGPTAIPDSYIVTLEDGADSVEHLAGTLAERHDGRVNRTFRHALRGFEAELTETAARRLAADPAVASVTQNHRVRATDVASWGLDRVDQRALPLDGSYTAPRTAPAVRAYIIDSGINLTHAEFAGRVVSGTDTIDHDDDATDCLGHGTHVAGTVGGATFGVAPDVRLVAVRVLDCDGWGTAATVIGGIDWVTADHDPHELAVANLSLGGTVYEPMMQALTDSIADGITYGVAAGNDRGADACATFPAAVPAAIAVAATAADDSRAAFSNIGSCVDVFAPGAGITSAFIGGDTATRTANGTSMAAPHVTGAAALILADHPTYTPAQVTTELLAEATPDVVTDPGAGSPNRLLYVDGAAPADDFTVSATPASLSTTAGGTVSTTVSTTVTRGAPQPVTLSVSGLPAGATATFSTSTVDAGGSATLTVSTTTATPAGSYQLALVGAGSGATRPAVFQLTVDPAPGCAGATSMDVSLVMGRTIDLPITVTGCSGNASPTSTIAVDIDHTDISDLEFYLVSPDGTVGLLVSRSGFGLSDFRYTMTRDLSAEVANGTWKLRIVDSGSVGTGFLDSWGLDLGADPLPAPACGGMTDTDVRIGAAATVESHLTVTGCAADAGGHAYAELHIFNQYAHHLETTLVAPDGVEFPLFDPRRNFAVDIQTTYVVDLSGHRPNGRWTLRVQDTDWTTGNDGYIDGWRLTL
ncbi:S8 family serine peptidase [Catenuloplanes atrovinosus]|uniref:Subtilisin family serine protease/subtilisin-like proprotein convertase family protein n=1 Tax=Catenuloplanes atrovinosus TaxID=137266 RepID=A0AAE3YJR5_9ACTN|nr:S8 family serine peptidase [Catenuloplanes atrovinosus]MDR7273556.1 subtilisin family serine protease/subtilisin-like proprotein convertase family protein [Catenuloplanes atrovinosus]